MNATKPHVHNPWPRNAQERELVRRHIELCHAADERDDHIRYLPAYLGFVVAVIALFALVWFLPIALRWL